MNREEIHQRKILRENLRQEEVNQLKDKIHSVKIQRRELWRDKLQEKLSLREEQTKLRQQKKQEKIELLEKIARQKEENLRRQEEEKLLLWHKQQQEIHRQEREKLLLWHKQQQEICQQEREKLCRQKVQELLREEEEFYRQVEEIRWQEEEEIRRQQKEQERIRQEQEEEIYQQKKLELICQQKEREKQERVRQQRKQEEERQQRKQEKQERIRRQKNREQGFTVLGDELVEVVKVLDQCGVNWQNYLSAKYRIFVILKIGLGLPQYSIDEISKRLNMSPGATKDLRNRVIIKLSALAREERRKRQAAKIHLAYWMYAMPHIYSDKNPSLSAALSDFLEFPVSRLRLGIRASKLLSFLKINTVGEVLDMSENFTQTQKIGSKTMENLTIVVNQILLEDGGWSTYND